MRETKEKQKSAAKTRGESMILTAVMLMVFVILGGAVLTAAASASATANARIAERQAYYYGRSMLDVLDESMRKGKLGEAVRGRMMSELVASGLSSVHYGVDAPLTLTYTPAVGSAQLADITFSDVTISCTGKAESGTAATGMQITRASLQLRTVDMDFTVTYEKQSVTMHIQYRCTCNVSGYNAGTGAGTWTQNWVIQLVG